MIKFMGNGHERLEAPGAINIGILLAADGKCLSPPAMVSSDLFGCLNTLERTEVVQRCG